MRLAGKSIVITGASGIAAATARLVAAEGASVFVISLEEESCRQVAAGIEDAGGRASWAIGDLTEEPDATRVFGAADDFLGQLDGVVAVAGVSGRPFGDGALHEIPLSGWAKTIEGNLTPAFLAAREGIRRMRRDGGSLVLVGSVLARDPVPDLFATHAYATAKGAIETLTTTLAAYYAGDGVRVNTLAPGLVSTPMAARAASDEDTVEYSRRKQPLAAGFLDPEDVARAAVFLLSEESGRITGQVIAVDGGWGVTQA